MAKLGKFLGILYIIIGVIMAVWGSRFIFYVLGGSVGLIVAGIVFLLIQTLFLPLDSGIGIVIAVVLGALIIGGLVAWCTAVLSRKFAVQIMGAVAGIVGLVMIGKIFKQGGFVAIGLGIVGGILGWFIGAKLKKFIRAFGTSILGAFLIVMGIGQYAPGFPSITGLDVEDVA